MSELLKFKNLPKEVLEVLKRRRFIKIGTDGKILTKQPTTWASLIKAAIELMD